MSAGQTAITYDIRQLYIAPVSNDCGPDDATFPNGYTLGPLVKVPGVKTLSLDLTSIADELRGDGTIKARVGYLDKIVGSFAACYDHDVSKVILGAPGGTNANGTTTHWVAGGRSCANQFPYFYLQASACFEDKDTHPVLYKCKLTGGSLNYNEQSFGEHELQFEGISTETEFTTDDGPLPLIGTLNCYDSPFNVPDAIITPAI